VALTPQQQQQQQQQQRMIELQRQQQQQQQQQLGPGGAPGGGPYTQRPAIPATNVNARSLQQQVVVPPQPQFIKPGSAVPPGYVQTIHANGMPQIECVETGTINFPYGEAPLPPIIILRNHDKQLIQIEGQQNDFANQLAHITSRITSFEGGGTASSSSSSSSSSVFQGQGQGQGQGDEIAIDDEFVKELTENRVFISSAVESIMKNTNLSDMVNEIEPIKAENRELRSLLLSQQEMLNGMNSLLFKLLNTMHINDAGPSSDARQEEPTREEDVPLVGVGELADAPPEANAEQEPVQDGETEVVGVGAGEEQEVAQSQTSEIVEQT
jgi:hypothetical protein